MDILTVDKGNWIRHDEINMSYDDMMSVQYPLLGQELPLIMLIFTIYF